MNSADRAVLEKWSRSRTLPVRVVVRSRMVLMLDDGAVVREVATALHVAPGTVRLWKRRFEISGVDGLKKDASGRGRKPTLSPAMRQALRGLGTGLPTGIRACARALGVSASTVSRWRRRQD